MGACLILHLSSPIFFVDTMLCIKLLVNRCIILRLFCRWSILHDLKKSWTRIWWCYWDDFLCCQCRCCCHVCGGICRNRQGFIKGKGFVGHVVMLLVAQLLLNLTFLSSAQANWHIGIASLFLWLSVLCLYLFVCPSHFNVLASLSRGHRCSLEHFILLNFTILFCKEGTQQKDHGKPIEDVNLFLQMSF